ncbi:hypothetical protein D3C80_1473780 [compost metagenome]
MRLPGNMRLYPAGNIRFSICTGWKMLNMLCFCSILPVRQLKILSMPCVQKGSKQGLSALMSSGRFRQKSCALRLRTSKLCLSVNARTPTVPKAAI